MPDRCAIIGMDVVTPLGTGTDEVWSEMMRKTCGLRPMRRFPHGKYLTDVAGELPRRTESALLDDPASPRAWSMALKVSRGAIEQAGARPRVTNCRTGLILATTKAEIAAFERMILDPSAPVDDHWSPALLARDLAAELGLTGPCFAVSNACASGLVALIQAARLLARGDAEMMLVTGVDVLSDFVLAGFSALAALSAQPCRPYDASRDGLSVGEGAGAFLLTSTPRSDDTVLGTLNGWGVTNDANHITGPSRTGDALRHAISTALKMAGQTARDIHYLNGHGTGTRYNDDMESKAFHAVFSAHTPPVSSIKGYIGHTLGAAGVIEAALCLVAMRNGVVPACLGLTRPGVARPLNLARDHVFLDNFTNTLSVKCGFGGVNAAVVLSKEIG